MGPSRTRSRPSSPCRARLCDGAVCRPLRPPVVTPRLEVVLLQLGETFLPMTEPCASAVRKWIPPQTRASMISFMASENRSKLLVELEKG